MNTMVNQVLKWEKELELQQQGRRHPWYDPDAFPPADPQPRPAPRKTISIRLPRLRLIRSSRYSCPQAACD